MNSTTGSTTRATTKKASWKPSTPPIRLSATIAPDSVDRYIPARLNDSFQARPRDASSDQCSVDRIWSRSWTGVGPRRAARPDDRRRARLRPAARAALERHRSAPPHARASSVSRAGGQAGTADSAAATRRSAASATWSRVTSRWVTARIVRSLNATTRTPASRARATIVGASAAPSASPEDEDVRLDGRRVEIEGRRLREPVGEEPGVRVVVGQAVEMVVEGVVGGRGEDADLAHRAAGHPPVADRAVDEGPRAREHRAARRAEPLRERDVDDVERPRQLRERHAQRGRGVPESRAVEERRQLEVAGQRR